MAAAVALLCGLVLPAGARAEAGSGVGAERKAARTFQLESGAVSPAQSVPDSRRPVRLIYRFRARRSTAIAIRVIRVGQGTTVRRFLSASKRPGRWHRQAWNGLTRRGRPVASGRYRIAVGPSRRSAADPGLSPAPRPHLSGGRPARGAGSGRAVRGRQARWPDPRRIRRDRRLRQSPGGGTRRPDPESLLRRPVPGQPCRAQGRAGTPHLPLRAPVEARPPSGPARKSGQDAGWGRSARPATRPVPRAIFTSRSGRAAGCSIPGLFSLPRTGDPGW